MKRHSAVAVLTLTLLAMLTPGARASGPAVPLAGSIAVSGGPPGFCMEAGCQAFFAAGCPTAMLHEAGVTDSIEDVSMDAGKTLTFTWSDTTAKLYDSNPALQNGEFVSQLYFYVVTSCTAPAFWVTFALSTYPSERTYRYTLPQGAKYLVAAAADNASAVTWTAT